MIVVLDSNILFSALISQKSSPYRIYQAWQQGEFELITCTEQIAEIREASRHPRLKSVLQPHLVGIMLNNMKKGEVIEGLRYKHETADVNDAWLLALAEKVNAHYLVTGDKRAGILSLQRLGQTQIVTASEFCEKVL